MQLQKGQIEGRLHQSHPCTEYICKDACTRVSVGAATRRSDLGKPSVAQRSSGQFEKETAVIRKALCWESAAVAA